MANRKSFGGEKDDKRDLHGEIRRLRKIVKIKDREIARLEKWINGGRGGPAPEVTVFEEEDFETTEKRRQYEPPKPRCTECGSEDTTPWELNAPSGLKRYITCNKCGKRRLLNPKVT